MEEEGDNEAEGGGEEGRGTRRKSRSKREGGGERAVWEGEICAMSFGGWTPLLPVCNSAMLYYSNRPDLAKIKRW